MSKRGEWSDKRRTKISLLGLTRRCWNSSYAETAEAWGTGTPNAGDSWKTFGGEEKNTARGRDSRRRMRASDMEAGQHLIYRWFIYWSLTGSRI